MAKDFTNKGYWGKCVEVDLTTKKITITDRHMQYIEQYGGGRPLGDKMVWEALKDKPGYDAMGPENPVMFIPGPCTGSPIAFGSRYMVVSKSALTMPLQSPYETPSGIGYAACGGHFGPNLKWAGFDMVYITGESATPLLLKIDDNSAELVDATDFWGLDVPEAQELAKEKYGTDFSTSFVGPAAEHGVRWADVAGDTGRAAARGGAAVILGKRKLKGIIARGSQVVPYAEYDKVLELRQNYYNALYAWKGLEAFRRWGTLLHSSMNSYGGFCASKNHQYGEAPAVIEAGVPYYQNEYVVRHRSCVGCVTRCMKFGVVRTGKYKGTIYEGPDYEAAIMNGHDWLIETGEEVAYLAEYVESQGMDCINTGAVIAFMIEAVEKGYLKTSQIDDIKLTWGATDEIKKLLVNLIYNTENPIYDVVRRGAMPLTNWMVEKNGAKFEDVMHITSQTKNNGWPAWWAAGKTMQAGNYAISNRGGCHVAGGATVAGLADREIRDLGVFCQFGSQGGLAAYAYYEILNAVMGLNFTKEQWLLLGERAINLERAILIEDGFRRRDDWPAERIFDAQPEKFDNGVPTVHAGACVTREWLTDHIETYYKQAAWDPETTCPSKGKLQELGLEDVIPYLEKALAATSEKMK